MQARYYDPVIGRFYSNDPIGFTNIHTFNRYAYVNNNPYKYIDPTGMECTNRDGVTNCVTDDYDVKFPTPKGFPGTDPKSDDYHYYTETVGAASHTDDTEKWVKNNPTPGNPNPATPGGTPNDATPVVGNKLPIPISPVVSFATKNNASGSNVVVNVTLPGHPLHPGIVVREVTKGPFNSSTISNYGEGNGKLQQPGNILAPFINGVWQTQVPPGSQ
jgi:hypothetical protein